jgi:hypothetical protein
MIKLMIKLHWVKITRVKKKIIRRESKIRPLVKRKN